MAEYHQHHQAGRSMLYASLAGVAVGAPLLGMMGFSFLATLVLLVITSPLLLLFSPLLLCFGLVFAGALAGFAVAATMAIAGVSTLAWMYREIMGSRGKEQGKDWAGYLRQKVQENSSDALAFRA